MTETKTKPIHEIRLGNVKAVVWPGKTRGKPSVTYKRLFKREGSSQWETSDFFGPGDQLRMAKLCDQVDTWFRVEGGQADAETEGEPSTLASGHDGNGNQTRA